jgi:hypothetical protein
MESAPAVAAATMAATATVTAPGKSRRGTEKQHQPGQQRRQSQFLKHFCSLVIGRGNTPLGSCTVLHGKLSAISFQLSASDLYTRTRHLRPPGPFVCLIQSEPPTGHSLAES